MTNTLIISIIIIIILLIVLVILLYKKKDCKGQKKETYNLSSVPSVPSTTLLCKRITSAPFLQDAAISTADMSMVQNPIKYGSPSTANYNNHLGMYEILIPIPPKKGSSRSDYLAYWLDTAILMAQIGWNQGGIPIGSSLIDASGKLVAMGHNNRHQWGDPTAHGEIDCLRNAGNRQDWKCCTLISTLSCCQMCSGMAVLYQIPRIVAAENITFQGPTQWLIDNGIDVTILTSGPQHDMCVSMMERLKSERLDLWNSDIGITVCSADSDCAQKYDFPGQSSCINKSCNCELAWFNN